MCWDPTLPVPEPIPFPRSADLPKHQSTDSGLDPEVAEYFLMREPRSCPRAQLTERMDAGFAVWRREKKKRERVM